MSAEVARGVAFPVGADGSRSTSKLGRGVVADALREVDPAGARAAERETNWRSGYITHLRRLTEAGLGSRDSALAIARAGLASTHERMRVIDRHGNDHELTSSLAAPAARGLSTVSVTGQGEPVTELTIPYRGRRLAGEALRRQLDTWVVDGVVEPSCAAAVGRVIDNPGWLSLDGTTVIVLGAGAELGPLRALLAWGATVAGVDLPDAAIWSKVLTAARERSGTLLVPVAAEAVPDADDQHVADQAGIDLIAEVAEAADWVVGLPGRPVVGTYAYADGGTHVRVSLASDMVGRRVAAARDDLALAFLATPTDVFAVPGEAVAHSVRAYEQRSRRAKLVGRPLRTVSGGRLLRRNYAPGVDPGICDALVAQQGPNYALAKRLQRWRAAVARADGTPTSLNVAPSTRTRSVVKNRVLAAAYAGAHRFGIEIFEPETSNALMAALLVHDVQTGGGPDHDHPWQDEAYGAAHGGLWRAAYAPRSALGLATVLGMASRG
jgi:hypothetical protein